MLKKIWSKCLAFHITFSPAVRYIFYKPDGFIKGCHSHRGYSRRLLFQITIPLVRQASNDLPLNLNLSFRRSRNLLRSSLCLNVVKPRPTTPTSATPLRNSLNIIHFKKKLGATLCKTFHNPKIYIYIRVYKTSPFKINEYFIVITPLRRGLGGCCAQFIYLPTPFMNFSYTIYK